MENESSSCDYILDGGFCSSSSLFSFENRALFVVWSRQFRLAANTELGKKLNYGRLSSLQSTSGDPEVFEYRICSKSR